MAVHLRAALVGDLRQVLREQVARANQTVRDAVAVCTGGLHSEMRRQVVTSGLGQRLANSFRSRVYDNREQALGAAGVVWSKAPHIARGHAGAEIVARGGRYLAIPLPAAGRGRGGRRLSPQEWERMHGMPLRPVYRRDGTVLLVADGARLTRRGRAVANLGRRGGAVYSRLTGRTTVPIFVLVRRVTLRQRLDLAAAAAAWAARLPAEIERRWRVEAS